MSWDPIYLWFIIPAAIILSVAALYGLKPSKKSKAESPFTEALSCLLAGDKKSAMEKLRQVVKEDTDNIDAYLLYGEILREMKQYRKAIQVHRELTIRRNVKAKYQVDIQKSLLLDYHLGGYHREALKYADSLLKMNKKDTWALTKKLSILEELEEWHEAGETAKRLQSITGKTDKTQLALYKCMEGIKIVSTGKEHDGRLRFREAMRLDKECALAYLELAASYIRDERPGDAIAIWKQFFQILPDLAYLAMDDFEKTAFDLNRFQELEEIYRGILYKDPKNTRAVVALARFLDRKGETDTAIEICQEGLEKSPESLWIRRNLFRFLTSQGRFEEAAQAGLEVLNMVIKEKEEFICSQCGHISDKPLWHCPKCKRWNTFRF
ncbi:tetratricopeptide repeat protein [bacterium]|nr:tetratricopeptide repeat protein [FCB group bacterium]MBL7190977.1 tetratricopeptide repeat protein [bacterium]